MLKRLSVIMPAYNEEDRIEATLVEIAEYLKGRNYEFEIVVLNDGSKDTTVLKVKALITKYPQIKLVDRRENLGKGRTVREGMEHAKYPICLFIDADNSTSIREWPAFEGYFDKGFKVVIASRHIPGSKIVYPQPFMRRFLGTGYRVVCRRLFGLRCSDFNCGFKAYETHIAKEVYRNVVMHDWTFDVEAFCLLKQRGIPFAEVPVTWTHCQKESETRFWSPIRTAFRTLNSIFQLKQRF